VADEFSRGASEPTKTDAAASAACTKSGAFALAISIVLILLIPAWIHRPREAALGRYAAYRFDLTLRLDQLDHNPFWIKFSASNKTVESTPLSNLPNPVSYSETTSPDSSAEDSKQKHVEFSKTKSSEARPSALHGSGVPVAPTLTSPSRSSPPLKPGLPAPPTIVSATITVPVEIPELKGLLATLNQLNDSDLLTDSRSYSSFYNFSIARWAQRRSELLYRNAALNRCHATRTEEPHKGQVDANFVPKVPPDVLLSCLTLSDVRELAGYEELTLSNPDPIGANAGREIDLSPGALPRDLYAASLVGEALSFFVMMYFAAFAREAMASKGFPTPGTLFGAFSRSRWTLLVMLLAFCAPVVSSFWLALVSRRWPLYAESVLVMLATISAFHELQQKSYFSTLNPRIWIQRNAKRTLTQSEASQESVGPTDKREIGATAPSPSTFPTQPPTAAAGSNIEKAPGRLESKGP